MHVLLGHSMFACGRLSTADIQRIVGIKYSETGGFRLVRARQSTTRAFHWLLLPARDCLAAFSCPDTLYHCDAPAFAR
jgi:hypothetical protein